MHSWMATHINVHFCVLPAVYHRLLPSWGWAQLVREIKAHNSRASWSWRRRWRRRETARTQTARSRRRVGLPSGNDHQSTDWGWCPRADLLSQPSSSRRRIATINWNKMKAVSLTRRANVCTLSIAISPRVPNLFKKHRILSCFTYRL